MTTLKDKIKDIVVEQLRDVDLGTGDKEGMIHVDEAFDACSDISETLVEAIVEVISDEIKKFLGKDE